MTLTTTSSILRQKDGISLLSFFLFLILIGSSMSNSLYSQCGPGTPTFVVDLSGSVDSLWVSPSQSRADTCCGSTDVCVQFLLTLDSAASGIIFDVCGGAVAPGALAYKVSCGPETPAGEPLCLSGPGPHLITFCKPGNNANQYCITSIPRPYAGPDIAVNDGCIDTLTALGYDDTTIVWTSVFPGPRGAYDTSLSCTQDCPTTIINGGPNYPPFIDFEVCGRPTGECLPTPTCDTVRVFLYSTLNVEITPQNPTVCFGQTGTWIKANGSGGNPPYLYTWSTNETTDSIFVGVGTYIVELQDGSGCPPTFDTVTVTSFANPISADAGPDSTICSQFLPIQLGGTVIAASGGRWYGPQGTFSPSDSVLNATYTPTATELSNGFVDIYLNTTGNGTCPPDRDTVRYILEDFDGTASFANNSVSCFGGNDGSASINVTGSNPPYSFQWGAAAGNQTGSVALNLTAGSYLVTITDANGCTDTASTVIAEPTALQSTISSINNLSCFGGSDGDATVLASGGSSPYFYLWSNNDTSATASSLSLGTYFVTVTDANGCTIIDTATIIEPTALQIAIDSIENVSCFNGSDGSASIIVSGGTNPYTYSWPSNNSTEKDSNLTAGNYMVTVTDQNGCSDSLSITISEPSLISSNFINVQNALCNGNANGKATIVASGGTAPYVYNWPANPNMDSVTTLSAGSYIVTVVDQNNCTHLDTVVIGEPTILVSNVIINRNVSCNGGNNGSATASATGGTPNYQFNWSSNTALPTDSMLAAGLYTVTITDANGCTILDTALITEPTPLLLTTSIVSEVNCNGSSDGIGLASATGGTQPYSYLWPSNLQQNTDSTLSAGTFVVTVTDANGCTTTDQLIMTEPSQLTLGFINKIDVSCFRGTDGRATASPTGGTLPYTFNWSNNTFNPLAANLAAGTYSVTITDARGCIIIDSTTITEPPAIQINLINITNVSCNNGSDGSVTAVASGGTAPFNYQWPGNINDSIANNLSAGIYIVTVTDDQGCTTTSSINITEPSLLVANILNKNDVSCYGGSDGNATASASGGTSPYNYLWPSNNTSPTENNLAVGDYIVTITDFNGCTALDTVRIIQPDSLDLSETLIDPSCFGENDGRILVTGSGGTAPYGFSWSTNATGTQVINLTDGTYSVTMSDNNSCTTVRSFTLSEPDLLVATVSPDDTICIGSSATLQVSATGGNGGYNFVWDNNLGSGPTKTVTPTATTTYSVATTDSKGCLADLERTTVYIKDLGNEQLDVTSTGDICIGQSTNISATHNGTLGPYSYNWNFAGQGLGPFLVSPNVDTWYVLTVSDGCGNPIRDSVEVKVQNYPTVLLPETLGLGCSPYTLRYTDTLNQPASNYTYNWTLGDGTTLQGNSINHIYRNAGVFDVQLTVSTSLGCSRSNQNNSKVYVKPSPLADFYSDPSITDIRDPFANFINTTDGVGNTYRWDIGQLATATSRDTSYLFQDTGTYVISLFVQNINGCTDSISKIFKIEPYFNARIPNAFTPNTNGGNGGYYNENSLSNDVFFIFSDYAEKIHLMIFNRWGELVFESKDKNRGWDGYYRGELSQSDVYIYKAEIEWTDGTTETKVGDITLLR